MSETIKDVSLTIGLVEQRALGRTVQFLGKADETAVGVLTENSNLEAMMV